MDVETEQLTVDGLQWVRTTGVLTGVVDPREDVVGLADLVADADVGYRYTVEFELLAPFERPRRDVVLVEAENRGRPLVLTALQEIALPSTAPDNPVDANYPDGLGNGFLGSKDLSYARVQWEAGIAAGVPETAQGVGEVIVRDFGRLLEGMTERPADAVSLPVYDASILVGVSQAGWFVNTFVAEGFNADPLSGRGVYDAAVAINGVGNWLAINSLAGDAEQRPYVLENGVPLSYDELLTRPSSDPLLVDVATYTDYYRLRASLTATSDLSKGVYRYDYPAPHAGSSYPDSVIFGLLQCNDGNVVDINPLNYRAYGRWSPSWPTSWRTRARETAGCCPVHRLRARGGTGRARRHLQRAAGRRPGRPAGRPADRHAGRRCGVP